MSEGARAVFQPFSNKQRQALTWWLPGSPVHGAEGIIADGAIRSGKTLCLSISFVVWAMARFHQQKFAMCGKTIGAFRRNVLSPLKPVLAAQGYELSEHRADNLIVIRRGGVRNEFYLFGGQDERSQDLIQGITLAGVFFDEVALMPESFVNQATGRCSVDGSAFWFNCNPAGPLHWFKTGWIDRARERGLLRLHFTMKDNPSLTERIRRRYERQYSGVFYRRYILGEWVAAEGLIYDMFDAARHVAEPPSDPCNDYWVSVDYGTQNPTVFLLWGLQQGVWHCLDEFYYDGRKQGKSMTDGEYADQMDTFVRGLPLRGVVVDPSAASFIAELRKRGYTVVRGNNHVVDGIRFTGQAIGGGRLRFAPRCRETCREFLSYVWGTSADGADRPVKENDHCMDAVRYFCYTILRRGVRQNLSR